MTRLIFLLLVVALSSACTPEKTSETQVHSDDIPRFWMAYDSVTAESDPARQQELIERLYLKDASPGLEALAAVRNYTPASFVEAINAYPKFWTSIRENTLKASSFESELTVGIERLRALYPELRPAEIYFTIGALGSNGTTRDSLVLIGSELALADEHTDASEFPEAYRAARQTFFRSNPIDDVVLLNIHEYVHTQQQPIPDDLLGRCLYEGVAEFVSCKAMEVPSAAPAIEFGKTNEAAVRGKFEREMKSDAKIYEWLWGDVDNGFGVRDLGYYIGYAICEHYFTLKTDKKAAIKRLIELDFRQPEEIQRFVDSTAYFSKPLVDVYADIERQRPQVTHVEPFGNKNNLISAGKKKVTLHFSTPMDIRTRGFEFGPLGEEAVLRVQNVIGYSTDSLSFSYEVELEPNRRYQAQISDRFLSARGFPLQPFLIDIQTDSQSSK